MALPHQALAPLISTLLKGKWTASSSFRGYANDYANIGQIWCQPASRRSQSTATESHTFANDDAPIPSSSRSRDPVPRVELASQTSSQEAIASTSSSTSKTGPTLDDLLHFRPSFKPPKAYESSSSPDFAVYRKRFETTLNSISKAFNKPQIQTLARRDLKMTKIDEKMGKNRIIRRIMTREWGLPDPEEWAAAEEKADKAKNLQVSMEEETFPLTETELFFLLGRLDGREMMGQLSRKHSVKLSIIGDPSGTLKARGTRRALDALKDDWENIKESYTTETVDTGSRSGLHSSLYRPLSMATNTFVAPASKNPKQVQVTSRKSDKNASKAVEVLLKKLALHDTMQAAIPVLTADSLPEQEGALMPYIARESLPWYLSALPIYGLSRWQAIDSNKVPVTIDAEDLRSKLLANLSGQEVTRLEARLGAHLFIDPDARPWSVSRSTHEQLVKLDRRTYFQPSTVPSLFERFQATESRSSVDKLRDRIASLSTSTADTFRRLMYRSGDPFRYVKLERTLPLSKEEDPALSPWIAEQGTQGVCNVLLPSSIVDARVIASASAEATGDLLNDFADIVKQRPPPRIQIAEDTYHLYEDKQVRATSILKGWGDMETFDIVLERATDRLDLGARSSGLIFRTRNGLEGLDSLVRALQGL